MDLDMLKNILNKEKRFSGKMLITLNDLSYVKELIQLYHTGLLEDLFQRTLKDMDYRQYTDKGDQ